MSQRFDRDRGGVQAITRRLAVSDDVQVGKDDTLPVRSAFFTQRTEIEGSDDPVQLCAYSGHVLPRSAE